MTTKPKQSFSRNKKAMLKDMIDIEIQFRRDLPVKMVSKDCFIISKNKERVLRYMYNNNKNGALNALDKYKKFAQKISAERINNEETFVFIKAGNKYGGNNENIVDKNDNGAMKMLEEMMKMIKWFEAGIFLMND